MGKIMGGTEQEKIKKIIYDSLTEGVGDLDLIILIGSIIAENFDEQSDIDLIVSCPRVDFKTKEKLSKAISQLETKLNRKFGVNLIDTNEILSPKKPLRTLDGKIFQALVEIKNNKNMILFDRENLVDKLYSPSGDEVKEHSLNNIIFFRNRNRKLSTHQYSTKEGINISFERERKALFIVAKLYIQLLTGKVIQNKDEIIKQMQKFLPKNSEVTQTLIENIEHTKNEGADIKNSLTKIDDAIEELSKHAKERL